MEYKTFENILNRIVKIKQDEVILSKAIRAFEPDCGYIFFTRYETLITDILKEAIELKLINRLLIVNTVRTIINGLQANIDLYET